MSLPEEKLAQDGTRSEAGPARCTLAQLQGRWGEVTRMHALVPGRWSPDDLVTKHAMGGNEIWRVVSITGQDVRLEKIGGTL